MSCRLTEFPSQMGLAKAEQTHPMARTFHVLIDGISSRPTLKGVGLGIRS